MKRENRILNFLVLFGLAAFAILTWLVGQSVLSFLAHGAGPR